jgi:hypothetical protein
MPGWHSRYPNSNIGFVLEHRVVRFVFVVESGVSRCMKDVGFCPIDNWGSWASFAVAEADANDLDHVTDANNFGARTIGH